MRLLIPNFMSSIPYDKLNTARDKVGANTSSVCLRNTNFNKTQSLETLSSAGCPHRRTVLEKSEMRNLSRHSPHQQQTMMFSELPSNNKSLSVQNADRQVIVTRNGPGVTRLTTEKNTCGTTASPAIRRSASSVAPEDLLQCSQGDARKTRSLSSNGSSVYLSHQKLHIEFRVDFGRKRQHLRQQQHDKDFKNCPTPDKGRGNVHKISSKHQRNCVSSGQEGKQCNFVNQEASLLAPVNQTSKHRASVSQETKQHASVNQETKQHVSVNQETKQHASVKQEISLRASANHESKDRTSVKKASNHRTAAITASRYRASASPSLSRRRSSSAQPSERRVCTFQNGGLHLLMTVLLYTLLASMPQGEATPRSRRSAQRSTHHLSAASFPLDGGLFLAPAPIAPLAPPHHHLNHQQPSPSQRLHHTGIHPGDARFQNFGEFPPGPGFLTNHNDHRQGPGHIRLGSPSSNLHHSRDFPGTVDRRMFARDESEPDLAPGRPRAPGTFLSGVDARIRNDFFEQPQFSNRRGGFPSGDDNFRPVQSSRPNLKDDLNPRNPKVIEVFNNNNQQDRRSSNQPREDVQFSTEERNDGTDRNAAAPSQSILQHVDALNSGNNRKTGERKPESITHAKSGVEVKPPSATSLELGEFEASAGKFPTADGRPQGSDLPSRVSLASGTKQFKVGSERFSNRQKTSQAKGVKNTRGHHAGTPIDRSDVGYYDDYYSEGVTPANDEDLYDYYQYYDEFKTHQNEEESKVTEDPSSVPTETVTEPSTEKESLPKLIENEGRVSPNTLLEDEEIVTKSSLLVPASSPAPILQTELDNVVVTQPPLASSSIAPTEESEVGKLPDTLESEYDSTTDTNATSVADYGSEDYGLPVEEDPGTNSEDLDTNGEDPSTNGEDLGINGEEESPTTELSKRDEEIAVAAEKHRKRLREPPPKTGRGSFRHRLNLLKQKRQEASQTRVWTPTTPSSPEETLEQSDTSSLDEDRPGFINRRVHFRGVPEEKSDDQPDFYTRLKNRIFTSPAPATEKEIVQSRQNAKNSDSFTGRSTGSLGREIKAQNTIEDQIRAPVESIADVPGKIHAAQSNRTRPSFIKTSRTSSTERPDLVNEDRSSTASTPLAVTSTASTVSSAPSSVTSAPSTVAPVPSTVPSVPSTFSTTPSTLSPESTTDIPTTRRTTVSSQPPKIERVIARVIVTAAPSLPTAEEPEIKTVMPHAPEEIVTNLDGKSTELDRNNKSQASILDFLNNLALYDLDGETSNNNEEEESTPTPPPRPVYIPPTTQSPSITIVEAGTTSSPDSESTPFKSSDILNHNFGYIQSRDLTGTITQVPTTSDDFGSDSPSAVVVTTHRTTKAVTSATTNDEIGDFNVKMGEVKDFEMSLDRNPTSEALTTESTERETATYQSLENPTTPFPRSTIPESTPDSTERNVSPSPTMSFTPPTTTTEINTSSESTTASVASVTTDNSAAASTPRSPQTTMFAISSEDLIPTEISAFDIKDTEADILNESFDSKNNLNNQIRPSVAAGIIKEIMKESPMIKIATDMPVILSDMIDQMKNESMKVENFFGKTSFTKIQHGRANDPVIKTTITLFTDGLIKPNRSGNAPTDVKSTIFSPKFDTDNFLPILQTKSIPAVDKDSVTNVLTEPSDYAAESTKAEEGEFDSSHKITNDIWNDVTPDAGVNTDPWNRNTHSRNRPDLKDVWNSHPPTRARPDNNDLWTVNHPVTDSSFAQSTINFFTERPLETTSENSFVRLQQLLRQFDSGSRPELSMSQFLGLGIEPTESSSSKFRNSNNNGHRNTNTEQRTFNNRWGDNRQFESSLDPHSHHRPLDHTNGNHRFNSEDRNFQNSRHLNSGGFEFSQSTPQALTNSKHGPRESFLSSNLDDLSLAASEGVNSENELSTSKVDESTTEIPTEPTLAKILKPLKDAEEISTTETVTESTITEEPTTVADTTTTTTTTAAAAAAATTTTEEMSSTTTEMDVALSTSDLPDELTTTLLDNKGLSNEELEMLMKSNITASDVDKLLNDTSNATVIDEFLEEFPEIIEMAQGRLTAEVGNPEEVTNVTLQLKQFLLKQREADLDTFTEEEKETFQRNKDKLLSSDAVRERLRLLRIFKSRKERQSGRSAIQKHFTKVKGATKVYQRTDNVDFEDIGVRVNSAVKLRDILSRRREEEALEEATTEAEVQPTTITPPPSIRDQLLNMKAREKERKPRGKFDNVVKVNGFRIINDEEEEEQITENPNEDFVFAQGTQPSVSQDFVPDEVSKTSFLPTVPPSDRLGHRPQLDSPRNLNRNQQNGDRSTHQSDFREASQRESFVSDSGFRAPSQRESLQFNADFKDVSDRSSFGPSSNANQRDSSRARERQPQNPANGQKKNSSFGFLEDLLVRQSPRNEASSLANKLKNKMSDKFLPTVSPHDDILDGPLENVEELSDPRHTEHFLTQPVFVTTSSPVEDIITQTDSIDYPSTTFGPEYDSYYDYYDEATEPPNNAFPSTADFPETSSRSKILDPHPNIPNALLDHIVFDHTISPLENLHQNVNSKQNSVTEELTVVGDSVRDEIDAFLANTNIDIEGSTTDNVGSDQETVTGSPPIVIEEFAATPTSLFSDDFTATEDTFGFTTLFSDDEESTAASTPHHPVSANTFVSQSAPISHRQQGVRHIVRPPTVEATQDRVSPPSSLLRGTLSTPITLIPSRVTVMRTRLNSARGTPLPGNFGNAVHDANRDTFQQQQQQQHQLPNHFSRHQTGNQNLHENSRVNHIQNNHNDFFNQNPLLFQPQRQRNGQPHVVVHPHAGRPNTGFQHQFHQQPFHQQPVNGNHNQPVIAHHHQNHAQQLPNNNFQHHHFGDQLFQEGRNGNIDIQRPLVNDRVRPSVLSPLQTAVDQSILPTPFPIFDQPANHPIHQDSRNPFLMNVLIPNPENGIKDTAADEEPLSPFKKFVQDTNLVLSRDEPRDQEDTNIQVLPRSNRVLQNLPATAERSLTQTTQVIPTTFRPSNIPVFQITPIPNVTPSPRENLFSREPNQPSLNSFRADAFDFGNKDGSPPSFNLNGQGSPSGRSPHPSVVGQNIHVRQHGDARRPDRTLTTTAISFRPTTATPSVNSFFHNLGGSNIPSGHSGVPSFPDQHSFFRVITTTPRPEPGGLSGVTKLDNTIRILPSGSIHSTNKPHFLPTSPTPRTLLKDRDEAVEIIRNNPFFSITPKPAAGHREEHFFAPKVFGFNRIETQQQRSLQPQQPLGVQHQQQFLQDGRIIDISEQPHQQHRRSTRQPRLQVSDIKIIDSQANIVIKEPESNQNEFPFKPNGSLNPHVTSSPPIPLRDRNSGTSSGQARGSLNTHSGRHFVQQQNDSGPASNWFPPQSRQQAGTGSFSTPERPTILESPAWDKLGVHQQQAGQESRGRQSRGRDIATPRPGILLPLGQGGNHITSVTQLMDEDSIPGKEGQDYPAFKEVPSTTSFRCSDHVKEEKKEGHLFPDVNTGCQVYHLCRADGRTSFLCPVGTIFNHVTQVCQWWFQVKCLEPFSAG